MFGNRCPSGDSITVWNFPPGFRSTSAWTVFHGAGVNHFFRCSGVVHAFHTSSGGTSTVRVNDRSSSGFIPTAPSVR